MTLDWVKMFADLPEHPKIKKLEKSVGIRAFDYTARAMLWLSRFRPDGNTVGIEFELEEAVRFEGEPGRLINAWREKRWIDEDGHWHDWDEIQTAHKERADAAARQRAVRDAAKKARAEEAAKRSAARQMNLPTGQNVTVTRDVTVTSRDVTVTGETGTKNAHLKMTEKTMSQNVTVTDEHSSNQGLAGGNALETVPSQVVTVTSNLLSLSSDLISSGGSAEGGAIEPVEVIEQWPPPTPRVDPRLIAKAQETGNVGALLNAVTSAMRPKRSKTIVGLVEAETIPASPDVLCASSWGREHAARFPALDGNNGRPSLLELVREMWPRFLDRCEHGTPTDALRSLSKWLSEDYATHKNSKAYDDRAAERGGGHKVDTSKTASWPEVHAQCVRFAKLRGVDEPPPLEDKERWKAWANANLGVYHEAKRAASKGAA